MLFSEDSSILESSAKLAYAITRIPAINLLRWV
jgi:hypothetical protein